jgi:hypothetical protein
VNPCRFGIKRRFNAASDTFLRNQIVQIRVWDIRIITRSVITITKIMVSTYRLKLRIDFQRSILRYDGKDILIVPLHGLITAISLILTCVVIFQ